MNPVMSRDWNLLHRDDRLGSTRVYSRGLQVSCNEKFSVQDELKDLLKVLFFFSIFL